MKAFVALKSSSRRRQAELAVEATNETYTSIHSMEGACRASLRQARDRHEGTLTRLLGPDTRNPDAETYQCF